MASPVEGPSARGRGSGEMLNQTTSNTAPQGHPAQGAPDSFNGLNGSSMPTHHRGSSNPSNANPPPAQAGLGPVARSGSSERETKSMDQARRKDSSQADGKRRPSATNRTCGKCGQGLSGQFVRALDDTFHLECFTCRDCGKIVASKFFPVPDHPPGQYPLCETDYFKRLDLICYACGGALRGSYITALDRKYHIEHFTCSVCPTVFGAQDSYYEHEGNVYCHYHYSTRFAQKCNGCQTAILKQFVEIFREGRNQHWHPECYMIHKYWNVRLHSTHPSSEERRSLESDANSMERRRVRGEEEKVEEKVLWIWRTLSAYEERSATCISDMLLHVSNGAYVDGVMSAKKFILHVDLLFAAADNLDRTMVQQTQKGLSYSREAKLLCKKVVAFFQLLAESQGTGVRRLGVTQELLSLVTGLAHYLKLLIRICLQGTLKVERETGSEQALHQFLGEINSLDSRLESERNSDTGADLASYADLSADTCPVCSKPVEDRCFRLNERVFHGQCLRCISCQTDLSGMPERVRWNRRDERILCNQCAGNSADYESGFVVVSRLQQYVHLLRVAHARLLATLRTSGALPHTSDDPNLEKYDSESGHRVSADTQSLEPPLLRSNTRSKSYAGKSSEDQASSYEQTLGDIRRLRSTRMDKNISNKTKTARTSRIIGGPQGDSVRPGSAEGDGSSGQRPSEFRIITDNNARGEPVPHLAFGNQDSIRLDDIPRLVAAEQAKDQRPNAAKFAGNRLVQQNEQPKTRQVGGHRRDPSGAQELDKLGPEGHRPKRYFSELSALEYFIVRHVAVLSMEPLLVDHFNQEELLDLIETRKPTFWGKFGKAFKNDKPKAARKKGCFGVPLDVLVERDGAESTDGVGPGALKVPAIIQDSISALRMMDMSVEGIFRLNGNIKRLKEMAETIDNKGGDAVDLNVEKPVQVAALLKKFLRELPDPVLTFKLHRLFITSQRMKDEDARRRILHLSCCLLPKSHRDTMEVLFNFMNWVASFSTVDEEVGSKMDVHNLATVLAPNILFSDKKNEGIDDSFLAIEAVHSMIQLNDVLCEVPEDFQSILNDSSLFGSSADITTKEILKRYGDYAKRPSEAAFATSSSGKPPQPSAYNPNGSPPEGPQRSDQRGSYGSAPIVHRIDEDHRYTARQAETNSSMRTGGPSSGKTDDFFYQQPHAPYANSNPSQTGSRDSFSAMREANGSQTGTPPVGSTPSRYPGGNGPGIT